MADDDPLFQQARFFVHLVGARLPVHFQDGPGGDGKVIFGMAVAQSRGLVSIFQVGQVDLHFAFQPAQGFHLFVAPAVVHHRYGQFRLQGFQDGGQEMGGGHQIDVVGPLGDQVPVHIPQAFHRHRPAPASAADLAVLAEHALEGAA